MDKRIARLGTTALLMLLFGTSPAAALFKRESYSREFHKTAALPAGGGVEVDHKNGAVVVRSHAGRDVQVNANISVSARDTAEAEKFGQDIEISVTSKGNAISIETKYPERAGRFFGLWNISYSVDLEIVVPEDARLAVKNRFGPVSIADVKAPVDIRNAHGAVSLTGGRGKQRVENTFAAVDVSKCTGDVAVVNSNGSVTVSAVEGSVDLSTRFGQINAEKISGGARIFNGNGGVSLTDAGGASSIETSFAAVVVRTIRADLTVRNSNGSVDVRDVKGAVDLTTSFAEIRFEDVVGKATATNSNGAITGRRVAGASARTSFGAVDLQEIAGDVDVENGNGKIAVKNVKGAARLRTSFAPVTATGIEGGVVIHNGNSGVDVRDTKGDAEIETSFGPVFVSASGARLEVRNQNGSIEVVVPAKAKGPACTRLFARTSFGALRVSLPDSGYTVKARTSFAHVESELPVTASGMIGGDTLSGTVGDGACDVTLTNNNGSIQILKASAKN